jgi:Methyltransferase domain
MKNWLRALRSRSVGVADLSGIAPEALAEELLRRIEEKPGNPLHDLFYRHGFHLLRKHFYLPIPDDGDALDAFWETPSEMIGIDMNDAAALALLRDVLPRYLVEFRQHFPVQRPLLARHDFYLINGGYMAVDAHVYYGLIRHHKPRRIVEIGAGNSTLLATAALARNQEQGAIETHFSSIEPYPWDLFKGGYPGLTELIQAPVQQVPLELFTKLAVGDILFIDSSHVLRSGNDVHYEYLEILPRLAPGVLVHIHDISLPRPYPKVYYKNQLYWNEQYLLQAFLMHNRRFEVVWPGNYMMLTYPEEMLAAFPEIKVMRETYPSSEPTAFWMRVRE